MSDQPTNAKPLDLDELERRINTARMTGILRDDLLSAISELRGLRPHAGCAALGSVMLDVIEIVTENDISEDSPRDDVVNAYITQWKKHYNRIRELEAEVESLRSDLRRRTIRDMESKGVAWA